MEMDMPDEWTTSYPPYILPVMLGVRLHVVSRSSPGATMSLEKAGYACLTRGSTRWHMLQERQDFL